MPVRRGWHVKQSFSNDFVGIMEALEEKYGDKIFAIQGIAGEHMDLVKFSKRFFKSATVSVADVSVDGNANVTEKNIMQYNYEANKALMKLNSLYLLFKWVKRFYGHDAAEEALEKVVNGELFVNDLVNYSMPYSYYQQTPVIVRVNGGPTRLLTMKALFEEYEEFAEHHPDRETINMTSVYKELDFHRVAVGSDRKKIVLSGKASESVLQRHRVEVLDGNGEWVVLKRILRHQNERGYVIYQTKNGDMAFVTDDHPVIMEDGSEKNAEDLVAGDTIRGSENTLQLRSIVDVPADMAYLMGFIAGDGSVGRHKFYSGSKNLTGEEVAIKVDELRGNIHIYQKNIVETKIYEVVTRLFPECAVRTRDDRQIVFNSNHFRMLLAKVFGVGYESSYAKSLPNNVLDWDAESVSAYVAGLVDSDGIVTRGSVNLRMSAYAIVNQLSDVLAAMGVFNHKSVEEIGESSSGHGKGGVTFLFGLSFQPNEDMIDASVKLSSFAREGGLNSSLDTNERTNEVSKTFRLDAGTQKVTPSGEDVLGFVYDITTESGTFYACGMTQHNCFAFDLRNLLASGMAFFDGNMPINPPKRSDSFFALLIQSTAYISNQILGAASYPDFFVALDWFYRKEMGEDYAKHLDRKETWGKIKNQFQNLIFSLNFPFRGNQSAFTNLSVMDKGFLAELFRGYAYPDGTKPDLDSVLVLSRRFFEYYAEINCEEGIFTFPIMTLAISLDENGEYIDPEFVDWAAEANCAKATANIFQSKPNAFSSCCRLKSEFDKVASDGYQNSFGVGGLSIGSHRVAGLNLPRIAILERDDPDILEKDLAVLHKILVSHRRLIQHRIETGHLPLYTTGWIDLRRQYSTIGFVGGYEYVVNKGLDIKSEEGIQALANVLQTVERHIAEWQKHERREGRIRIVTDDGEVLHFEPSDELTVKHVSNGRVSKVTASEYMENQDSYLLGIA